MIESIALDDKIRKLEDLVNTAANPIIWATTKEQWDEIFELMPTIQDYFKTVRYQKIFEREQAWIKFNNIRNNAFESKNKQFEEKSKEHYNKLWNLLEDADYNWLADSIAKEVIWGALKVSVETMKARGVMLKETGNYFTSNKSQMTKHHKAEIHEKFIDVRKSHDIFWERVRDYREEQNKVYEEKKDAWNERQQKSQEIKDRLFLNKEKLQASIEKSEDYLLKLESQKENLEEKISSAYSENFRERHEQWLSELENKITDVEGQIETTKGWLREINDKLDNWT